MKISDIDLSNLFEILRTFTYTTGADHTEVTAALWEEGITDEILIHFNSLFGNRKADEMAEHLYKERITAESVASVIQTLFGRKWKHLLEMWLMEYDPVLDKNLSETKTITTTWGKVTTMQKGVAKTTEQLTNGMNATTYGRTVTNTYGDVETVDKTATFDSANNVNNDSSTTTRGNDTSGTTGTDTTNMSVGKYSVTDSGSNSDTLSGTDKVTEELERKGNNVILQDILFKEADFWDRFNFYDTFFKDVASVLALPVYEMEE